MISTHRTETTNHFTTLFTQLPDPVVEFRQETDSEPTIVNANVAFHDMFASIESVVGHPLRELIVPADSRDGATAFDQRSSDGIETQAVVERATSNGRRKFRCRRIHISDSNGFAIYSDVTEKYHQEQYLDVLHRVLRHNLRNDLTVINGQIERAFEAVDSDEGREALESVQETVSSLRQLCSEAQTIRKVTGQPSTLEVTPLMDLLWPVIEDCRERFPAATISVDCPADLAVLADNRLRIVVDSLVDNAARHNTSETPSVTMSVAAVDDETVELAVADDGPGIPESERRVIMEDTEVSPLSHGSGLGLWIVKWLTESYGGCLDIDTLNVNGSIVRIRLPQAST
ncbi:PAS domain-containing sensor histidine kinase [Halonotius sp. GCM10025705]|uniref:PAS domain-containing sensor histidine kinase n=1 Tax=Halonotius sp. GCM10025705 TaxID=3252678 RepID=UPI00360A5807